MEDQLLVFMYNIMPISGSGIISKVKIRYDVVFQLLELLSNFMFHLFHPCVRLTIPLARLLSNPAVLPYSSFPGPKYFLI